MHPNPRKIAPILLLVVLSVLAWWLFGREPPTAGAAPLSASGTIEATQVKLAPELGGQILEVLAEEGQAVQAGQVLVQLDDALLQAQLSQAKAALALAQANYDLVAAGVPDEQRQVAVAAAELELLAAHQALQELNDTASLAAARLLQAVAAADKALDRSNQRLDVLHGDAKPADIDAARATVVLAKDRLDKARKDFNPYEKKPADNLVRAVLLGKLSEAQKQYDAAVTRLNNLLGKSNRFDLNLADAEQALAEAQLADVRRQYEALKDGPDPDALALAEGRLAAARAHLDAARAQPAPEQLAVAQAQIESARAAIGVLEAQLARLVLKAPLDGQVLARHVEPGEVALPGAALLTLGRLDHLSITVYVPEDLYGTLSLGQLAQVTVDSFPGQAFQASVVHIAGQAEFTPRNVQTAEGRRTTVFAIKLAVENAGGRLKPGMPADVAFDR